MERYKVVLGGSPSPPTREALRMLEAFTHWSDLFNLSNKLYFSRNNKSYSLNKIREILV